MTRTLLTTLGLVLLAVTAGQSQRIDGGVRVNGAQNVVILAPDGASTAPLQVQSADNGLTLKNNANTICYGSLISGSSPARLRLTTCNGTPLVLQENGGLVQITKNALVVTSADMAAITNTTLSTVGVPVQMSPRLRFSGTAWNTTAVAASNYSHLWLENMPVSGATPSALMRMGFTTDTDGSAAGIVSYPITIGPLQSAPTLYSALWFGTASPTTTNFAFLAPNTGAQTILNTASGTVELRVANATHVNMGIAGVEINGSSNAMPGVPLLVRNAANSATVLNITDAGVMSGPTYASSGAGMNVANVGANSCGTTSATIAGNSNTWSITVGATSGAQCRVAFAVTAATRWSCAVTDETTGNLMRWTAVDTTHGDVIGSMVAGDVLTGVCFPR